MPGTKVKPNKYTLIRIMISIVCFLILFLLIGMAILSHQKSGVSEMYFKHPLDFGHSVNKSPSDG